MHAFQKKPTPYVNQFAQYGWSGSLAELDHESKDILLEAFTSDPTWSSQGTARLQPPNALLTGRLEIVLDTRAAPKAAENFRCLCTGEKGKGKASGKPLYYKGNKMHRAVKGFVIQGGDVVKGDGSGGDSIYGGAFKDEKTALALKHDGPGIVAMANSGPHTNRSQFYVTLAVAAPCDGKHVVLGKVVNPLGLELLRQIDETATSVDGIPVKDILISDCGQL
jgi:cyclophilin family peptidyl-prolyl cis-trans isomerase